SLAVQTHFAEEPNTAPVSVAVIRAGGTVLAQQRTERGSVVRFAVSRWPGGAYEIRLSTSDAWGQPVIRHLPWYKGDAIAGVRELMDAAQAASRNAYGDTIRMLAAMVQDRLGGSLEHVLPDAWRLVHSPLMEFAMLRLDVVTQPARARPAGGGRISVPANAARAALCCGLLLPRDDTSAHRWPLMAPLHGYPAPNPEYA